MLKKLWSELWSLVWELSEISGVGLGIFAPWVFNQMMGQEGEIVMEEEN